MNSVHALTLKFGSNSQCYIAVLLELFSTLIRAIYEAYTFKIFIYLVASYEESSLLSFIFLDFLDFNELKYVLFMMTQEQETNNLTHEIEAFTLHQMKEFVISSEIKKLPLQILFSIHVIRDMCRKALFESLFKHKSSRYQ